MILVGPMRPSGTRARGGWGCQMVSDTSELDLMGFAELLGLSRTWLQGSRTFHAYYTLSPGLRKRALAQGAVEATQHELLEAQRRRRAAEYAAGVAAVTDARARAAARRPGAHG